MDVQKALFVDSVIREQASDFAAQFGPSAAGMWPRLNCRRISDGSLWSVNEGMIGEEFAQMLTDAQALVDGAASKGVAVDLPTAQYLLAHSIVTYGSPAEAMQRLGFERLPEDGL